MAQMPVMPAMPTITSNVNQPVQVLGTGTPIVYPNYTRVTAYGDNSTAYQIKVYPQYNQIKIINTSSY